MTNTIWLAVDEDGSEWVFDEKPEKDIIHWYSDYLVELPPGSIEAITGVKLSWQDEPLEWEPKNKES